MPIIAEQVIEEVRSRANIVEVIGRSVHLKRAGNGSWKACCPFHQEKTPSFVVNESRQRYHCFGCGAGGDVFKFVMETEHVDFPNAVTMLAGRYGVVIPENDTAASPAERQAARERAGHRARLYQLLDKCAGFFQQQLENKTNPAVCAYLDSRKLDPDTIKKFRIGAAPDSWDAVIKFATKAGFSENELLETGMAIRNEESGRVYDRFRNRLVFPIWNEQGKVAGFSARTIEKETAGAKYVNSPETPVFKKSNILYALPLAKNSIVKHNMAILCEGQLDVIAMQRAGLDMSIAPQGTAFTPEQAKLIRRYADRVVLAFDSDSAGQKAALRALELLFPLDFEVKILTLPEGEDPDGIFRTKGAGALKEALANALDVLPFIVRSLKRNFNLDSPYEKSRFLTEVLNCIDKISNPIVVENYLQKLSEMLKLKEELVFSAFKQIKNEHHRPQYRKIDKSGKKEPPQIRNRELFHAKATLLEIALSGENYARRMADDIPPEILGDDILARAVNTVIAAAINGEYNEAVPQLSALDREEPSPELSRILSGVQLLPPDGMEKAYSECMAVLKRIYIASQRARLMSELRKPECSEEEKRRILTELTRLK